LVSKLPQGPKGYLPAASRRRHIVNARAKKIPAPAQAAAKPDVKVQPAPKATPHTVKTAVKSSPSANPIESQKTAMPAEPKKTLDKPADQISKAAVSPKALPAGAPAPAKTLGLKAPLALKPGRRSSARVSIPTPPPAPMVPTHAPDAAKASYSTMTERLISPPLHVAAKKDPKLANNWKTKPGEQLTDEEVKAMPDSEYMNDKQLAFFRHKLSVLKQDIHASAGATTEHLREDAAVVPDPADRATIEEEHALELRTRDRERKLLKKIEQSIARIDSGDYGYCDETGEPIGVGRLIARPTANLSLEAQQRREIKQKMFGD
jgi:DnaK suppressor protein